MDKGTFTFGFSVNTVPHNKETAEKFFGVGAYGDGEVGEEAHASNIAFQILQDAFAFNMQSLMKHMVECKDGEMTDSQKQYRAYLERKADHTEHAMNSFKFIRKEE